MKKWRKSIRGELAKGWDDAPGIVDEMESGVEYASWSSARRHALGVSATAVALDVADVRESFGFAPVDLQYKILSWPKL